MLISKENANNYDDYYHKYNNIGGERAKYTEED